MATYVISDIHGQYDMFMDLLYKISFSDKDTLYILGDIIDRGPHPIKTMRKLMEMPNVICLLGNHEYMALGCLEFLMNEITEKAIADLDGKKLNNLVLWMRNGCSTTIKEFRELCREDQIDIIEYIKDFLIYEEVSVAGKDYLLVHAGLGNFRPGKDLEEYSLNELVWDRTSYDIQYYQNKYIVTGHTPTQIIKGNSKPGFIYRNKGNIAIDCGAFVPAGRLAALCLDSGEDFYSYTNKAASGI